MAETVTIRPGRVADAVALAELGRILHGVVADLVGFDAAQGFIEQQREPNPPYPDQVWMRRDPR